MGPLLFSAPRYYYRGRGADRDNNNAAWLTSYRVLKFRGRGAVATAFWRGAGLYSTKFKVMEDVSQAKVRGIGLTVSRKLCSTLNSLLLRVEQRLERVQLNLCVQLKLVLHISLVSGSFMSVKARDGSRVVGRPDKIAHTDLIGCGEHLYSTRVYFRLLRSSVN